VQSLSALLPREGSHCRIGGARAGPATGGRACIMRVIGCSNGFLLCNGDSLFDCNLARLLSADDDVDTIGRMMLRRVDDAVPLWRGDVAG